MRVEREIGVLYFGAALWRLPSHLASLRSSIFSPVVSSDGFSE